MEAFVSVALAKAVPRLPRGPGWWYEPKFDGHRVVMDREPESVVLQARSGRIVTSVWMDLAMAGMRLPPGTVLDGEAVIWNAGKLDFGAVQSRANSSIPRARALAEELPASYAVWDLLIHPDLGNVRSRPYTQRRQLLLEVLADIGPPIQPVPATDDYDTAMLWYEKLQTQGIEGIVAKRATSVYRPGRIWQKIRHSETTDLPVVGYTGAAARPRALAVRRPDGSTALSQRLAAPLSAAAARYLLSAGPGPRRRTHGGDIFTSTSADFLVEALAGTTRHAVVTITRVR
ncbi:DNA ligase [Streptomyces xantholiticus]|uniref:DNA ligase n=1 Tax=Streptomyces xantholiticus TaxID=68285 RepID=A0ABV1V1A0_9ACTN